MLIIKHMIVLTKMNNQPDSFSEVWDEMLDGP